MFMAIRVTYSQASRQFGDLLEKVAVDGDVVIIGRRNRADVAMILTSELNGLLELVHLFQSPANGLRLLSALERARGRSSG
jgi:prevent-host-death family protein